MRKGYLMEILVIRYIISIICIIAIGVVILVKGKSNSFYRNKIDKRHVNEESFQNYAKFYGKTIPSDVYFDHKLQVIYQSIVRDHMTSIRKISEKSDCALTECVLKIKYLKNKRLLGDYYIDTTHYQILPCSVADQALLDKYKPYIYGSHLQIDEMAKYVANPKYLSFHDLKDEVYQELKYLDKKNLLNGLKIDDIDRIIIYYSIEKRKTSTDFVSTHCPNCGAINDVDKHGKTRCKYCKTILVGSEYEEKEAL